MTNIAFLFPGQGSQSVGMGRDFYESSSLAREIFSQADESLGYGLSKICFEGPEEELKLTRNTQPALLTVSTIAFRLLGRQPRIAAGHSLGEYSALVASGALKFEAAVRLVHKRGQYMQDAVPLGAGAMAALIGAEYESVVKALTAVKSGLVEIANWNSREQIVIAGETPAVEEAVELIQPLRSVMLPVSAPFHCRLMAPAEEKLAYDLKETEFEDPAFPIVTNVDAAVITRGDDARDALKRQVSRPVLWYKSMQLMGEGGVEGFVELGAGKVLSGLAKRIGREWSSAPAVFNVENQETLDRILGTLFP